MLTDASHAKALHTEKKIRPPRRQETPRGAKKNKIEIER
jgi:hypothetical protein